jgi:hypothetical protein
MALAYSKHRKVGMLAVASVDSQEDGISMQRYDLRRFLQYAPVDLVQQYLMRLGIDAGLEDTVSSPATVQCLFAAISQTPRALHCQIHSFFRAVYQLADVEGINTIRTEMRRRKLGRKAMAGLEHYPSLLGQALWTCLQHPDICAGVRLFRTADRIARWHRSCVPSVPPLPQHEAIQRLQDDLRAYYKENQDRGEGCAICVYLRDARCYWFARVQDYADEVLLFDDCQHLYTEPLELAFEIIFVHDQQAGTLAIACKGDLEHVNDLCRLFGRAVLNTEMPTNGPQEVYHLQRLLDRKHQMPIGPDDPISAVQVQYVGIEFLGQRRRGVVLHTGNTSSMGGVHEMIDSVLVGFRIPRDLMTVTQVGLQFMFRARDGQQPAPQLIQLTPQFCSCTEGVLSDDIRQLLRRWGLYDRIHCDHPPAGD